MIRIVSRIEHWIQEHIVLVGYCNQLLLHLEENRGRHSNSHSTHKHNDITGAVTPEKLQPIFLTPFHLTQKEEWTYQNI